MDSSLIQASAMPSDTPEVAANASGKISAIRNEIRSSHFSNLLNPAIQTERKEQLRKFEEKLLPSNRRGLEGVKMKVLGKTIIG